ncbi:protein bfr2 [Eurytemora carolleeae]|uniref:protein bfr2 n=1 Tax=Eurytemora carolleeae TaxID=1294199 RepID=UPI000C77408F|nr:protein bfr2 [Eurytemora carolleeae]|eukprot:XP_023321492.1 protein bfr2-like [Eurytemora affinis]
MVAFGGLWTPKGPNFGWLLLCKSAAKELGRGQAGPIRVEGGLKCRSREAVVEDIGRASTRKLVPLISNEEQFDNLNKDDPVPRASRSRRTLESTPKKRALSALESVKWDNDKENQDSDEDDDDDVENENDAEEMGRTEEKGIKTLKIIQLGTEEVKKYAILNKKDGEEDSDDDDDFDREDRDISFNHDDDGRETNEEMEKWLDNYTDRIPEETTIKVAKKYPSKNKFPCPKCPKIWNWPWELRRHLVIHFKPQKLDANTGHGVSFSSIFAR